MLAILEDHLSLTQPPAMFDLYRRANDLFDQYDLEDYQLGYDDLLISSDGSGDGLSIANDSAIYNLTMQYLLQIMKEHQITLSDSASMLHYITVLEFIKQIEFTELVQEAYDALSCEEYDNIDKFAQCMEIVSGIALEDSMLYLDEIPDCVIKTTKDYFANRVQLEVQTETLDATARDVYREMDKYARVVKGQNMRSYQYLFEAEGAIGLPFDHHYKQNEDYLTALPITALIYECIGYALISQDGLANPQKVIMDCLGNYIGDLEQLANIQYEVSTILIQYRNEVASGIGLVV